MGPPGLEAGSGLETRDPKEIVSTDLKLYEAGGLKFAIAQVEVTNLVQLDEHLEGLRPGAERAAPAARIGLCDADGDGCGG